MAMQKNGYEQNKIIDTVFELRTTTQRGVPEKFEWTSYKTAPSPRIFLGLITYFVNMQKNPNPLGIPKSPSQHNALICK